MKSKISSGLAFALVGVLAAPALAADAMKDGHDHGKMMADSHDKAHKMSHKMAHKKHGKMIVTKDGTMKVCKAHGCLMTVSKDGNRMTMMGPKGEVMVGDKASKTLKMMDAGSKVMDVAMDSKEAKMFMDHTQSMDKMTKR